MRQAIEEGFILDVLAQLHDLRDVLPAGQRDEPDDPEVPVGKASAALARFVSLHPTNLAQKAEIIVEHFRHKTAAQDRRARQGDGGHPLPAARRALQAGHRRVHRREGLRQGATPLRALVAFSGTVIDPTAPSVTYTEAMMNGFGERQLPKRFASDEYQVLVVAEKYQTGFDQPLLHTMYVDKKLAGVKAVQTLSRLNRTHPGKDDTFVLDFANTAEEIRDAFAPVLRGSRRHPHRPERALHAAAAPCSTRGVIDPDRDGRRRGRAAGRAGRRTRRPSTRTSTRP